MKMKIVIDANIVFSILLARHSRNRQLFFYLYSKWINFVAPEFCKQEIFKYLSKLAIKKNLNYEELLQVCLELFNLIKFYWVLFYKNSMLILEPEVNQIDPKDIDYVALAYKLWCPLWTNDKKLKQLKSIKVLHTEDLLSLYDKL